MKNYQAHVIGATMFGIVYLVGFITAAILKNMSHNEIYSQCLVNDVCVEEDAKIIKCKVYLD